MNAAKEVKNENLSIRDGLKKLLQLFSPPEKLVHKNVFIGACLN